MNRRHVLPQLGGTLRIYFLFAYYYALLNLCRFAECHYPRLVILDLVPDIAKGETMRDRAGLVLEPFVFWRRVRGSRRFRSSRRAATSVSIPV
jgi:hypothetical protein